MAAAIHSGALAAIVFAVAALAQLPQEPRKITPVEAQARQKPSYAPVLLGQRVAISGLVSSKAINFGEYAHLPIVGGDGSGVLLERERGALDGFAPGDRVDAIGSVSQRTGLPVIALEKITKVGRSDPPEPHKIQVGGLSDFRNIGKYVTLETYAITSGQNAGGDVLVIGGGTDSPISIFYPRYKRWNQPGLRNYNAGDRVRVTGIASQYCPVEPYDRGFQLLIDDPSQVVLLERGWMIPPDMVLYLIMGLVMASGIWWIRERRMAEQRRTTRGLMSLSEEVLSAKTVGEVSRKVQTVLPHILHAQHVDLYLYNRTQNVLDHIPNEASPNTGSIALDQPSGAFASAAALCFRNRALLNIPDFRRNPILEARNDTNLPVSAVFLPMFAQGEVLGVVGVHFRERIQANRALQGALQHVANQIAASLRLQEQQSIREQLLRTEKMAAAGQLISAVAHDLRAPLNAIRDAAMRLGNHSGPYEEAITAEADRGLQIVSHLLSFARTECTEARPINFYQLISIVMEAREPEWKRKNIRIDNALPVSPVEVFADESELEQVMLSLLIHVEHAVEEHSSNTARVSSRVLGNRVQVSIDFSGDRSLVDSTNEPASGDSFSLRVCQAIAQSNGGDIRLFETPHGALRYELELPVYHTPAPEAVSEPLHRASRILTAILIEPDAPLQRRLLTMLSIRGHRAIPIGSAEEAVDMLQRMSFDLIFCTVRLPGLSWVEFYKRVRRRISAFVLLAESYDSDAGGVLKDGAGFILSKPLEESALDNVLAEVEARHAGNRP